MLKTLRLNWSEEIVCKGRTLKFLDQKQNGTASEFQPPTLTELGDLSTQPVAGPFTHRRSSYPPRPGPRKSEHLALTCPSLLICSRSDHKCSDPLASFAVLALADWRIGVTRAMFLIWPRESFLKSPRVSLRPFSTSDHSRLRIPRVASRRALPPRRARRHGPYLIDLSALFSFFAFNFPLADHCLVAIPSYSTGRVAVSFVLVFVLSYIPSPSYGVDCEAAQCGCFLPPHL